MLLMLHQPTMHLRLHWQQHASSEHAVGRKVGRMHMQQGQQSMQAVSVQCAGSEHAVRYPPSPVGLRAAGVAVVGAEDEAGACLLEELEAGDAAEGVLVERHFLLAERVAERAIHRREKERARRGTRKRARGWVGTTVVVR
jgi:hypothetical protein